MVRKFAVFAALLAAFVLVTQAAEAGSRRVDPRLKTVAVGVGAASTAAYFAINDWNWKWGSNFAISQAGAIALTTIGCAALSPIVATLVLQRPLKYREAHILIGSCVVPIIGGWLVNEAYNAHLISAPDETPAKPTRPHARKHHARKK